MHSFFTSPRPLAFAHRGGAALAPENTLAAFEMADRLGVDGFELDVHMSRDGTVVVHHDHRLDRTTDRQAPLEALTADELARVDAGFHFAAAGSTPFRGLGIGIPTLASVLTRYPRQRVIVEMKGNHSSLAEAVVRVVRECGAVERVCVGSFGRTGPRWVRANAPEIATSAARDEVCRALYRSRLRMPRGSAPFGAYQVLK